jgi:hypothetical protein
LENKQLIAQSLPSIDFDEIIKPAMKSFAPGTVDRVDEGVNVIMYGVSASLWKGSSGGPCVQLEGGSAGAIFGLGKVSFTVQCMRFWKRIILISRCEY